MARNLQTTHLYHITDIENLPKILASGGLLSDVTLGPVPHEIIGYAHIKRRRMTEYRVACCGNRFVGEFVPFYFCPRSPMLFTINRGNTGRPEGCQSSILHLRTSVARALKLQRAWAISDGNAGAGHTDFFADIDALDGLDWAAIRATSWSGRTHEKAAEFLVADFFEWSAIEHIGCHNDGIAIRVAQLLEGQQHRPVIAVERGWYY